MHSFTFFHYTPGVLHNGIPGTVTQSKQTGDDPYLSCRKKEVLNKL